MRTGSGNRRQERRYPMALALRYKVIRRQQVVLCGGGVTTNMSSGGVAFTTGEPLPPGSPVELDIDWPVLLQDACPLKLVIHGRVVRSDDQSAAVRTARYEFRVNGARGREHPVTLN